MARRVEGGRLRNERSRAARFHFLYVAALDGADSPFREEVLHDGFARAVAVADIAHGPSADEIELDDSFLQIAGSAFRQGANLRGERHQISLQRSAQELVPKQWQSHKP